MYTLYYSFSMFNLQTSTVCIYLFIAISKNNFKYFIYLMTVINVTSVCVNTWI